MQWQGRWPIPWWPGALEIIECVSGRPPCSARNASGSRDQEWETVIRTTAYALRCCGKRRVLLRVCVQIQLIAEARRSPLTSPFLGSGVA